MKHLLISFICLMAFFFSSESQAGELELLPEILKKRILFYLSGNELISVGMTCKGLRSAVREEASQKIFRLEEEALGNTIENLERALYPESIFRSVKIKVIPGFTLKHLERLLQASHLQHLDLDLRGYFLQEEGKEILVKGLQNSVRVRSLNLTKNDLTSSQIAPLLKSILTHFSLKTLIFSNNLVGDENAGIVGEILKKTKTLEILELCHARIGEEGIRSLSKGLEENTSLTSLDLSANKMSLRAIQALAQGIKVNKTLLGLDLESNDIEDEGATALGEGLKCKDYILYLNLNFNKIGEVGKESLYTSLKNHPEHANFCLLLTGN